MGQQWQISHTQFHADPGSMGHFHGVAANAKAGYVGCASYAEAADHLRAALVLIAAPGCYLCLALSGRSQLAFTPVARMPPQEVGQHRVSGLALEPVIPKAICSGLIIPVTEKTIFQFIVLYRGRPPADTAPASSMASIDP